MAMQQGGKQPAAPGSEPKLTADDADELAANFKPAWEVDEPTDDTIDTNDVPTIVTQGDPPTMTGVTQVNGSNGGPAVVASPVISIGAPEPARAPEPSSEALEPDQVIEMQPAAAAQVFSKTMPMAQKPVSKPPPPPQTAPMSTKPRAVPSSASKDPFAAPAKPIRAPIESDDFDVPKKSGKGWVYVVVGLLVAVGAGGIVKFYLSSDEPQKQATPQNVAVPTAAKEDIPPPPAKDEPPSAPATVAANPTPPPPDPVKAPTPPPDVKAAPPPPPPRQQPVAARGGGGGGGVVRQAPPPPQPKTPPKAPGGGIVRDNPF